VQAKPAKKNEHNTSCVCASGIWHLRVCHVLQSHCLTVLQSHCLTVLQSYSLTVLQSHCLTVLQSYCLTVSLSHCLTVLQSYSLTVSLSYIEYFLDHRMIKGVSTTVGKNQYTTPGKIGGKLSTLTTRNAVNAAIYPPIIRCRWANNQ